MNDDYSVNDDFSTIKKYKIATIILSVVVLIMGFYIIVDKVSNPTIDKPSDKKSSEKPSSSISSIDDISSSSDEENSNDDDSSSSSDKLIKIDLSRIQEYLGTFLNIYSNQSISFSDDKVNIFGYLYSKEKLELVNFDNIALLRGSATVIFQTTRKSTPISTVTIPASELESTLKDLFGDDIKVTHQSFKYRYGDFVYDNVKNEYAVNYNNSSTLKYDYYIHKIVSQRRIKNQYEVIVKAGYIKESENTLYKNYPITDSNKIGVVNTKVTEEQYNQLDSYKFLFNINESGSINFISVNKIID